MNIILQFSVNLTKSIILSVLLTTFSKTNTEHIVYEITKFDTSVNKVEFIFISPGFNTITTVKKENMKRNNEMIFNILLNVSRSNSNKIKSVEIVNYIIISNLL